MGTIARLNTAKKKLAQAEQAMPRAYQNNYTDSINQKLVQLADASLTGMPPDFSANVSFHFPQY